MDQPSPAEIRFAFLFPADKRIKYTLHAPDLCDLTWSVFEPAAKRIIARGRTPEEAVDTARLVVIGQTTPVTEN